MRQGPGTVSVSATEEDEMSAQYEGYAEEFASDYADDFDAGYEFYSSGGRRREHGGVMISDQFDKGFAAARADDESSNLEEYQPSYYNF